MFDKVKSYYIKFILTGIALLTFSAAFRSFYQDKKWSIAHQANHFEEELNKADERLLKEIEHYYSIIDTSNLEALLNNPQENSLSLRLRYFLDYQYLKKK